MPLQGAGDAPGRERPGSGKHGEADVVRHPIAAFDGTDCPLRTRRRTTAAGTTRNLVAHAE